MQELEVYSMIGAEGFTRLVAAFYRQVPQDDLLGPMYPAQISRVLSIASGISRSVGSGGRTLTSNKEAIHACARGILRFI
jgi:hypothetical protein